MSGIDRLARAATLAACLCSALLAGCGGVADAIAEELLINKSRSFSLSTGTASCSTDPGLSCADIELFATIQHQGPRETRPEWFEYPAGGVKVVDHLYRNQQADGRWALSLGFSPNLPPGTYTGRVEVTLTALFTEYVPAVLNYRLEVRPEQGTLTLLQAVPGAGEWAGPGGTAARDSRVSLAVDPGRITRRWTRMLESLDATVQPALAEGRVLLPALRLSGEAGNATVLSEQDGSKLWSAALPGTAAAAHPGAGQVFWVTNTAAAGATTSRHTITAMSLPDGATRWQQDLPGGLRPHGMARAGGSLLVPTAGTGSQLAARAESDGASRWSTGLNEATDLFDYTGWGVTVDAAANRAYVNLGGQLSALRLDDGGRAQRISVPSRTGSVLTRYGMLQAPVRADAQTLLLLTHRSDLPEVTPDNQLSAVDLASGLVRWTVAGKFVNLPAVSGTTLYVANLANRQLEARSLADGSVLWNWPMEAGSYWQSELVLTQGHLFLSTDQQTVALDLATRQPVWRHARGGWLGLSSNGVLYLLARGNAGSASAASLTAFNLR